MPVDKERSETRVLLQEIKTRLRSDGLILMVVELDNQVSKHDTPVSVDFASNTFRPTYSPYFLVYQRRPVFRCRETFDIVKTVHYRL